MLDSGTVLRLGAEPPVPKNWRNKLVVFFAERDGWVYFGSMVPTMRVVEIGGQEGLRIGYDSNVIRCQDATWRRRVVGAVQTGDCFDVPSDALDRAICALQQRRSCPSPLAGSEDLGAPEDLGVPDLLVSGRKPLPGWQARIRWYLTTPNAAMPMQWCTARDGQRKCACCGVLLAGRCNAQTARTVPACGACRAVVDEVANAARR